MYHPRKFGYDVSVRPPVHTDAEGGRRESEVSLSGEEYVIAEVKFCISSIPLVSAVITWPPGLLKRKKNNSNENESFFHQILMSTLTWITGKE